LPSRVGTRSCLGRGTLNSRLPFMLSAFALGFRMVLPGPVLGDGQGEEPDMGVAGAIEKCHCCAQDLLAGQLVG
jgi:hypothetical protein